MAKEYRQPVYRPPAGAADLWLVRHGESMPAIPGQDFPMVDGHGDPALHATGLQQAERVGERLKNIEFAEIYVTKLTRTHQTAAPLAKWQAKTPKVNPDLHEVSLGDWDGGLYRIKAAERDPIYVKVLETQDWSAIPNAETREVFFGRVARGLNTIADAHRNERVAVFVHGGVIGAAMALASGSDAFAFLGAANGSISRIVVEETGRMSVRGFNDISHLDGLS